MTLYNLLKTITRSWQRIYANDFYIFLKLRLVQCFFYAHCHLVIEGKNNITLCHLSDMLAHFGIGYILFPPTVDNSTDLHATYC
ncbi:hypothetical protein D3C73_459670 [compost metagenome]